MICPQCGKPYDGGYCPSCGKPSAEDSPEAAAFSEGSSSTAADDIEKNYIEAPSEPEETPRPSHWLRNSLILVFALALLSAGAAVAAQQFGGPWGLSLPTVGSSSNTDIKGTPYEETLPSGHYVVGVDIPAGVYTIIAQKGEGRLFTALGVVDAQLVAEGGPETVCGFNGVSLEVGDTMTVTGMTVHVKGTASGATSARSNTATKTVTLAVLSGSGGNAVPGDTTTAPTVVGTAPQAADPTKTAETGKTTAENSSTGTTAAPSPSATFIAGKDFPAGVYTVEVLRGSGTVVSGSEENGGIRADMSLDEKGGSVKEFRNVNLAEGAEITITGLDIQLVPSI